MQISMKCSIAVHCLIFIYEAREKARVTSTLLAQSTSCNPVVIRYTRDFPPLSVFIPAREANAL